MHPAFEQPLPDFIALGLPDFDAFGTVYVVYIGTRT